LLCGALLCRRQVYIFRLIVRFYFICQELEEGFMLQVYMHMDTYSALFLEAWDLLVHLLHIWEMHSQSLFLCNSGWS
jgi:hypothetical protein